MGQCTTAAGPPPLSATTDERWVPPLPSLPTRFDRVLQYLQYDPRR